MRHVVKIKAEQIARLVVQGISLSRIAVEMGMSYEGLRRITLEPEYQEIEADVRNTILGKMDATLDKRADMRQHMADEMEDDAVPEAFKILVDNLKKKRDLKTALEILDRDPRRQFAKGASGANAAATEPAAQRQTPIDTTALSQAVKDADITHTLLQKEKQKPAQA